MEDRKKMRKSYETANNMKKLDFFYIFNYVGTSKISVNTFLLTLFSAHSVVNVDSLSNEGKA